MKKRQKKKRRVYTYKEAVERLLAANPTLSEQSVHILFERGLVEVEGGFVFSRDLRVNFKNMLCLSLEQSLELLSRIRVSVLVVLVEDCDSKNSGQAPKKFTPTLLQIFRDRNHKVVTLPGNHHIHLTNPEVIAPLVTDYLRTEASSLSTKREHKL